MNDLAIGRVFRRIRQRRDWRQEDVAAQAGISDTTYSEIERGQLEGTTIGKLRAVARVLEIDLAIEPRWRGGALDRELSRRHGQMTEAVTRLLIEDGWEVRPEVSFSHFGERGIVDLVAWHPAPRTMLLIELQTELTDVNGLLGATDRRRRLAGVIASSCSWDPRVVAQWIVLADGRTNRRRLADYRAVLRAAFPTDGRVVRGWLRHPRGRIDALWFLPDSGSSGARPGSAPRLRVRRGAASVDLDAIPANFRGLGNLAETEPPDHA